MAQTKLGGVMLASLASTWGRGDVPFAWVWGRGGGRWHWWEGKRLRPMRRGQGEKITGIMTMV